MKAILMNIGLTFLPLQVQPAASVWDDPTILLYTVTGFIFIVLLLVLIVTVYLLQVIRQMTEMNARELAKRKGIEYQEEPSWWSQVMQWSNRSVPLEKEETVMLDHNYDGIRELDNYLPPWWKWLFYATIVWGAGYLFVYHVAGSWPLQDDEYQAEVPPADEQLRALKKAEPGEAIDENTVAAVTDAIALADGKSTYTSICSSCHRLDGGGDIGPNLTDAYWKHGGDIRSIFKVVKNGVSGTNMVAWGSSMSPEKIRNVSSYVLTLVGTSPSNAKKPEGDLYQPQAPAAVDSTQLRASN
ncbi:MAG: cbb3-type cytochrome c oxidase N-terminal domain-containing protein [Cyclobacteriaceae bacterium]